MNQLTKNIITVIKNIPKGSVLTYGTVAAYAGAPRGARQVSWVLKTYTERENLPWHRVINSKGQISIKDPVYHQIQKQLLIDEGIDFDDKDRINLDIYLFLTNI